MRLERNQKDPPAGTAQPRRLAREIRLQFCTMLQCIITLRVQIDQALPHFCLFGLDLRP